MEDRSKDVVVSLLLREPCMDLAAINQRLKETNKKYSYHTTYKSIRKLMAEGVIEKNPQGYSISCEWAKQKLEFSENIKNFLSCNGLMEEKISMKELGNIMELNRFQRSIESEHLKVFSKDKKSTIIWAVYHCYNYLLQPAEELSYIQKLKESNVDFHVLCYGNTPLDLWTKKAFDKFGANMKINAKVGGLTGFNIYDDLVVQTFYGQEFLNVLQEVYKSTSTISDLDLGNLFEKLNKIDYKIHVATYKDPHIISSLKGRAMKFFN